MSSGDEDWVPGGEQEDEDLQSGDSEEEDGAASMQAFLQYLLRQRAGRRRTRTEDAFLPENNRHEFEVEQRRALQRSDLGQRIRLHSGTLFNPKLPSVVGFLNARQVAPKPFSASVNVSMGSRFVPNSPELRLRTDDSRVYSGQFSSSGNYFVSASQDRNITVFSSQHWDLVKRIAARDIRWTVTSTDVSPDEKFVLYSTISPTLHLCNIFGDYEIHDSLELHADDDHFGIWCAKFSAGGGEVVAGCNNERVMIFDVERKTTVAHVVAHQDDINAVCYADKAYRPYLIVSGSDDTMIKVWDRRLMGKSDRPAGLLPGHALGLTHVTGKGDGVHILSNAKDQTAKLWDLRTMYGSETRLSDVQVEPLHDWDYRWGNYPGWGEKYKHPHDKSIMTYRGHRVEHTLIRSYFSPASTAQQYVCTGSADGCVYVYDLLTGDIVTKLRGHNSIVRDVSWHPTRPILVSSSWDGSMVQWGRTSSLHTRAAETTVVMDRSLPVEVGAGGTAGAGAGAGATAEHPDA